MSVETFLFMSIRNVPLLLIWCNKIPNRRNRSCFFEHNFKLPSQFFTFQWLHNLSQIYSRWFPISNCEWKLWNLVEKVYYFNALRYMSNTYVINLNNSSMTIKTRILNTRHSSPNWLYAQAFGILNSLFSKCITVAIQCLIVRITATLKAILYIPKDLLCPIVETNSSAKGVFMSPEGFVSHSQGFSIC